MLASHLLWLLSASGLLFVSADPFADLLAEASQRLGVHPRALLEAAAPADKAASITLTRRLEGGPGFHQTLALNLSIPLAEVVVASNIGKQQQCNLAVLQPLPSDFFADPYQLEGMVAGGHADFQGFDLFGPLDLEL
jgi:hypothetical protein